MSDVRLSAMREAQRRWSQRSVPQRLWVIRTLRAVMAREPEALAALVPNRVPGALHRSTAETLVAEVMPLLAACKFLEREAARLLRTERIGRRGRPMWLAGVATEIERAPLGVVLVVAPGNYPLLLAGVQVLQALVAGNAVLWKPAPGTEAVAHEIVRKLVECGLPQDVIAVIEGDAGVVQGVIDAGVDHVVLTGSAETGMAVLHEAAEMLTPTTMELSGWDTVFVLPGASIERVVKAIVFGLRFNGAFTCMAPRRLFLVGVSEAVADDLEARLQTEIAALDAVQVSDATRAVLQQMVADARQAGAEIALDGTMGNENTVGATLIRKASAEMQAMRGEAFAPVLSVMRVSDAQVATQAHAQCAYGLTAAIFGPESPARRLARELRVGHLLINDVIQPTADPRVGFGGVGRSGFGVTRGRDGLLAMTRPRVLQVQRSRSLRAYDSMGAEHAGLFAGVIRCMYGEGWAARVSGMKATLRAVSRMRMNEGKKNEGKRR